MRLYSGMDLHSNNTYCGITNESGKRLVGHRLPNEPKVILGFLEPYRPDLEGIVIESTYNWYWLVDVLQENGYRVHLSHPSGNEQYGGSNIPMIDTMRSGWQTFCGWVAFGKVISTRNNFAPSEICSGNGLIWFDFVPPCF